MSGIVVNCPTCSTRLIMSEEDAKEMMSRATPPGYEMVPEGTMAVLRDLEWTFDGDWCNVCESHKNSGHADDCKLAAILTRHRATQKPQETPNAQG